MMGAGAGAGATEGVGAGSGSDKLPQVIAGTSNVDGILPAVELRLDQSPRQG